VVARTVLLGAALLLGLTNMANACQATGQPLLSDDFKTPDPGWGRADTVATFTPNGLVLTPTVDASAWRTNQAYNLTNGDWCVEIVNPATMPNPANTQTVGDVGVWFWGRDSQNFYTATISPAGSAAVDRLVSGKWQVIVAPTPSNAVRTFPGAVNEVEVVVHGDASSFFVNGSKVADFHGEPPPNGGAPGVYGESGPTVTAWVFARARLF
jgi:hypothetical protein